MCGICGKLYIDPTRPVEADVLSRMQATLLRRGPDEQGVYLSGSVGLASTRLSIIDLGTGQQPVHNEDQTVWTVYNGEIYNYPELREGLCARGHQFYTQSDTEVVVHLYEEMGADFPRALNGMFGLAVWDTKHRRLVLARDRLGIKPLYYTTQPDRILFGSEIKAILQDQVPRRVDPVALDTYLSLDYVPGPRTIFEGIQKLQAGHTLVVSEGNALVECYWDFADKVSAPAGRVNEEVSRREILDLLRESVRGAMLSDVPVGAFLSGGLDSSVVVALMSQVSTATVKTFSVGFESKSYDELPYARLVAKRYGTDHHELIVKPDPVGTVQSMADYFDEPFADSSAVAVHSIARYARQQVKVVLSGDGGDEVFAGYYTYQADKIAQRYRHLPRFLTTGLAPKVVRRLPVNDGKVSFDFKARRFVENALLPPLEAHYAWKAIFSEAMRERLYARESGLVPRETVELFRQRFRACPGSDLLNRLMYVDAKISLVDDMLVKVDRMSMAHSLEVRVPLLDHRLVEFAAGLPSGIKMRGLTLKHLFKEASRDLLPPEILSRKKGGFHVPIPQWLKADLREMVLDELSPERVARKGFFSPSEVSTIIRDHLEGRRDYSRNIWGLLMFSLWHSRYIAPAQPSKHPVKAGTR